MSFLMINVVTSIRFFGMTQGAIATRLGISDARFSRFCRGETQVPMPVVFAISDLIDAPVEDVARAFMRVWEDRNRNRVAK